MKKLRWELLQVLYAVSRLVNAIFGGWADETISGRCWRLRHRKPWCWLRPVIDWLVTPLERDHCINAYLHELLVFRRPPGERMPAHLSKDKP
mgnify:FL=1